MNKKNVLLAGLALASAPALAAGPKIPDICKAAANYTAKMMNIRYLDGTFTQDVYNPSSIRLKKDYVKFPILRTTYLGACEAQDSGLKEEWCQVAGGSPVVWKVEVGQKEDGGPAYPIADVIVTYNRGGCWVDEAAKK